MGAIPELSGHTLGCWCKGKHACHGDVLVKLFEEWMSKGGDDVEAKTDTSGKGNEGTKKEETGNQ